MWYELTPAPGMAGDQTEFLKRAQRAAGALGLCDRPNVTDPPTWDEGCLIVATLQRRWVFVADRYGRAAVDRLARACGSVAAESDAPEVLSEPLKWAHAYVPSGATLNRTAQDDETGGGDLRITPPENGLIALNVRRIGHWEDDRLTDWLADEFNTQPDSSKLRRTGVSAARIMAATPDMRESQDAAKQAAAALDLGFTNLAAHPSRPGLGAVLLAVLLELILAALAVPLPWWTALFGLPVLGWAVWRKASMGPDADLTVRPRHRWWTARTRTARSSDLKTRSMGDEPVFGDKRRRIHAYAFQRSTFPLPAGALAACAMPPADSEAASTPLTLRPHALDGADGPLVGYDRESRPVRLSTAALYGGVALLGEPGGGKSNSMHGIATHVARTLEPDDVMVMFESKGADSIPILRRVAPGLRVVDCMDPSTPMIDLLGSGGPKERAVRFADLMRQALGPNQIGPRSRIQIRDAVFVALTLMDSDGWEDKCRAAGSRLPRTWADAAGLLLGCDGIGAARLMGHAANMLGDADVDAAIERLHGGTTDSGRPKIADGRLAEQLSAPMNKMDILNQCPRLVRPGRRVVSWHAILSRGGRFAINIGAAERGAHDAMPEQTRRLVGALLFQGLRFEIERSCAGWQARGRRLDLFVDELTDVTGSDGTDGGSGAQAMEWLREKGRAFGVEAFVGTQNPLQLDTRLQASFLGFMTVCCYVLRAPASASIAADAIGLDLRAVKTLGPHVIACSTVGSDGATLPPMVLSVPWFDGDPEAARTA